MSVMEHSVSIASTTAVVPAGNQIRIVSVLQRVLAESMRLIELHKHVRWQISGSRLSKMRKLLDEHHKEQRRLLGLLVERLHALGGTDPVLADSSAQCAKVCRVIRGPIALHQLLRALLEAHEAVLRAAKPGNTHDDRSLVRDFAVGRAVLTNEQQWEIISGEVRRAGPQQRLIQADSSRLDE
jgi:DNA-binding ferritin-like protein